VLHGVSWLVRIQVTRVNISSDILMARLIVWPPIKVVNYL
jgi:hypothetical protein